MCVSPTCLTHASALLRRLSLGPVTTGSSRPGHLGSGSHTTRPTSGPGPLYSHTRNRAPGFDHFLTSFRAGPARHRIATTALRPSLALLAASTSRPPPPLLCLGSSRHAAPAPTPSSAMAQTPSLLNRSPASPADYHTPRRVPPARRGALRHAGPRPGPGSVRLGPPDSDCYRPHPPARVRGAGQIHSL